MLSDSKQITLSVAKLIYFAQELDVVVEGVYFLIIKCLAHYSLGFVFAVKSKAENRVGYAKVLKN